MSEKPRHRSGYTAEELQLVEAACLTVAVTLGAYLDEVCIVGGLVPALLIDAHRVDDGERHPGTNDLDLGLAIALLNNERYTEVSARLRAEDFEPDTNAAGNRTVQRWRHRTMDVTIDFLMQPAPNQTDELRVQPLEADFGALITPGLELAFDERVLVTIEGRTLANELAVRPIPVCGPAAFVVLKAIAFAGRGEPKDAFDLVYTIEHADGGAEAIADRLVEHWQRHREIVRRALTFLARDFDAVDGIGASRAADFVNVEPGDHDNDAADAHGVVDDLLRIATARGLAFR